MALATMYTNGWGVARDAKRAAGYFSRGLPELKRAAAGGRTNAFLILGEISDNGWGVPKDRKAAEGWFKKAVASGDKEAEILLARQQGKSLPVKATEDIKPEPLPAAKDTATPLENHNPEAR
jgi:TPR repeat protein